MIYKGMDPTGVEPVSYVLETYYMPHAGSYYDSFYYTGRPTTTKNEVRNLKISHPNKNCSISIFPINYGHLILLLDPG
mgnify:CR=1 FL=1